MSPIMTSRMLCREDFNTSELHIPQRPGSFLNDNDQIRVPPMSSPDRIRGKSLVIKQMFLVPQTGQFGNFVQEDPNGGILVSLTGHANSFPTWQQESSESLNIDEDIYSKHFLITKNEVGFILVT